MRTASLIGGAALAIVVGTIPAAASATTAVSAAGALDPLADQFMEAICPSEWWAQQVNRSWDRAFDRDRVRYGTAIPRYLRVTFRKAGVAHKSTAAQLRADDWPDGIVIDVRSVAKYYATAGRYLASRDTKRASRSWLPTSVIWKDPGAFRRIDKALALPASCRPYD